MLAEYLAGNRPRPAKQGRKQDGNLIRDTGIRYAILFLTQRGMKVERGRSEQSERDSACVAVANALHLSYDRVMKIWKGKGKADIVVPSLMPDIHVPDLPNPFPFR